nr:FAD-dependent oxidoreductase [Candidatus Sigynarchaeota archaeon]
MVDSYILEPEKKISVLKETDILVIGGSQSGVAAAICAKRANPAAKVLLIEQAGYLGGQAVGGLVVHWEFREYTNNNGQVLARGIGKEMISRIVAKGHSDPLYAEWLEGQGPPFKDVQDKRAHGDIPLDVNDIKLVLIEMCDEAGVDVLLHAKAAGVLPPDASTGKPATRGVFVETINGRYAIKARIVVDCTANADVAWWVGGESAVILPEKQVMGMQAYVWIENVDLERFVKEGLWKESGFQVLYPSDKQQMLDHVHQGKTIIARGFVNAIDEAYENEPTLHDIYEKTGAVPQIYFWLKTVKTRRIEIDGKAKYMGTFAIEGPLFMWKQIDPLLVTRAELNQVIAAHVQAKMHRYIPGWEHSCLDRTVDRIGFRETRIPIGLYALTKTDVLGHATFDDAIGRGSGHDIGRGNFAAEFGYDIPYRVLVPKNIDGLLCGARSVSVEGDRDDEQLTALNAHRGISACIVVSQASGVAAALCVKHNVEPRNLDVHALQNEL